MTWLFLCLAAGVVSACGFAPLDLWPLTLICFALLLWAIERAPTLRGALLRSWLFGVGQFCLGNNWIATAFTHQSNMPHWIGWLAVFLLSLYLAIYPAAAAGLAWRWGRRDRVRLVLVFAAAWVVTEYLRGVMFTGFAWNPLGVALLLTPVSYLSTWIGTYGLSGVAALLAGAIFLLARSQWRGAAAVAGAVAIATALLSPWQAAPEPDGPAIRLVQPGIPQEVKHEEGYEPQLLRFRQSARTAPAGPQLLLWPEDGVPYLLDEDPLAVRLLGRWLGPGDLLLTGGFKIERDPLGRAVGARNATWVVDLAGRIRGRYDKAHLVPYGEYLPMRWLLEPLGLSQVVPGDLDTWEGPGPRTLDLPGFGRAGIQICYEIIFSGQVVDRARRPDFIFNPSNDAWFGWWGPPQHFAQARLRAIEEGLPVLRSTPTGITGVIDARGTVTAIAPPGNYAVIDTPLPPARAPTLFARIGNVAPFLFVLFLVAAAVAHGRLQSRSKRARERLT